MIEKCSVTDCTADTGCGCAIYVYQIKIVNITASSFLHRTITSASDDEHDGSAIYLEYVSDEMFIHSSTFFDSSVPHDACRVDMWNCGSQLNNQNTFQECRFIECHGIHSKGGLILAWNNNNNVGITNTLFFHC